MNQQFSPEVQATINRWHKACSLQQKVDKRKITLFMTTWCYNMLGLTPTIEFIDEESQIPAIEEKHRIWNEGQLSKPESIARKMWVEVVRDMSVFVHREAGEINNRLDNLNGRERLASDRADEIIAPYTEKIMQLPMNGYRSPLPFACRNVIIAQIAGKDMKGEGAYERWLPLLQALEAGAWYFVAANDTIFVFTVPSRLKFDDDRRFHAEDGPAIEWLGFKKFFWHNVEIPEWIVMEPEKITPEIIEAEPNVEVRRVLIERYGLDKYLAFGDVKLIDSHPRFGELYVKQPSRVASSGMWGNDSDTPYYIILVTNSTPESDGTHKKYALEINPRHYSGMAAKSVHAAVASTFQWQDKQGNWHLGFENYQDYNPVAET